MSQFTRLTDGQTDRILIARPRLHSMQRGKKVKGQAHIDTTYDQISTLEGIFAYCWNALTYFYDTYNRDY